jgi:hypothetical protein
MIAPPHAQAQSFAKAILTDITSYPVFTPLLWDYHLRSCEITVQNLTNGSRVLTSFLAVSTGRDHPTPQQSWLMFHLGAVFRAIIIQLFAKPVACAVSMASL